MRTYLSLLCLLVTVAIAGLSAEPTATPRSLVSQTNTAAKPPPTDWAAIFKIHWQNRVRAFKEQNLEWQHVVLLGDSITEGFEVTKYFPGRHVLNRGIGADVIGNDMPADDPRGVLQRLDNSVFDCAPTDVFILIGINDLNTGRKVPTMEAGYRELLKRIRQKRPDLRIFVESVLPTRGTYADRNQPVREFNEILKKLSSEFGYTYLDLHTRLCDPSGELKADFTEDGLHLTQPAYEVWRKEILKALHWD